MTIKELKPSDSQGKNSRFRVSVYRGLVDGKRKYHTKTVDTIGEAKYYERIFSEQVAEANKTWWDRFDGVGWFLRILIGSIVLLLLSLCMGPASEGFKCSDSNLTSSQQRACDKAYENAYEEKWGRKPGKLPKIP